MTAAARVTFRDAAPEDSQAIAALHHAAADVLTATHGTGHWSIHVSPNARLVDPQHVRVRVGVCDGELVTTVRLQTKKPWAIDVSQFTPVKKALYLTNFVVAPGHQGQGLGRLAMADALDVARAWPADAVRLDSYDAAAGAGAFYDRCGFARRGVVVYKRTPLAYHELLLV